MRGDARRLAKGIPEPQHRCQATAGAPTGQPITPTRTRRLGTHDRPHHARPDSLRPAAPTPVPGHDPGACEARPRGCLPLLVAESVAGAYSALSGRCLRPFPRHAGSTTLTASANASKFMLAITLGSVLTLIAARNVNESSGFLALASVAGQPHARRSGSACRAAPRRTSRSVRTPARQTRSQPRSRPAAPTPESAAHTAGTPAPRGTNDRNEGNRSLRRLTPTETPRAPMTTSLSGRRPGRPPCNQPSTRLNFVQEVVSGRRASAASAPRSTAAPTTAAPTTGAPTTGAPWRACCGNQGPRRPPPVASSSR